MTATTLSLRTRRQASGRERIRPASNRGASEGEPTASPLHALGGRALLSAEEEKRLARRIRRSLATLRRIAPALRRHLAGRLRESGLDLEKPLTVREAEELCQLGEPRGEEREPVVPPGILHRLRSLRRRLHAAREELTLANLRLVAHVAKRYRDTSLPLVDLIQEGNVGLIRAVDKFDPEVGVRFSTYAYHWIRQAIDRAMIKQERTVSLPVKRFWERRVVAAEARRLLDKLGRRPTYDEIASALGLPVEAVRTTLRSAPDVRSLEEDPGGPDKTQDGAALQDERLYEKEMTRAIRERVAALLRPREAFVIARRFGLDGPAAPNRTAIGRTLGVSRERVRQIEAEAIEKLRQSDLLAELYANMGGS